MSYSMIKSQNSHASAKKTHSQGLLSYVGVFKITLSQNQRRMEYLSNRPVASGMGQGAMASPPKMLAPTTGP